MSSDNILDKVKKLRELTGVGFKDCKNAIDNCNGDIEKSIEFLRKKGIAKANKKMERVAADGLVCICEKENKFSIIEINTETDFAAKNNEFIKFAEELSNLALVNSGKMEDILISKMENKKNVKDNLVTLISKIGEKITLRRSDFIGTQEYLNFFYIHAAIKKNIGKIGVLVSLKTTKPKNELIDLGKQLSMHIAASNPIALTSDKIDQKILDKEQELIAEELKNLGKSDEIAKKISIGKLNKFKEENSLLSQPWVMEPKRKVKDVMNDLKISDLKIKDFYRLKIGE